MNLPLNIDLQQIFLHMLNFVILAGGLYFILYSPVKKFMDQRAARYAEMDAAAAQKLAEAEKLAAGHQAQLAKLEDELAAARKNAESIRTKALTDSQKELKELAMAAAEKLALSSSRDAFDEFLNLAEEGDQHEQHE